MLLECKAFYESWKVKFVTIHVWLLVPALFFISFIPGNATGITNLYRLLIVLPLMLCIRSSDVEALWENSTVKWFVVLCGWMILSLFFDGVSYKDVKLFWRMLNLVALFYLVFLVFRYHLPKISSLQPTLLFFGFLGALLILADWEALRDFGVDSQYYRDSSRGIFDHHLEVGWVMGLLGVISLNQFLRAVGWIKLFLYGCLFLFFSIVLLLVQARGGYVLYSVGIVMLLLMTPTRRTMWLLVAGAILMLVCSIVFRNELTALWGNILARGSSSRLPIWNNGIQAITDSFSTLLFGHGLSAVAESIVRKFQAAHFHNFFLNHAFYTGLVGLFLYFGLVVSALKKALSSRESLVWGVLVLSMQVAFITDGDRLAVNPSAMMLCFLLPLAIATFSAYGRS